MLGVFAFYIYFVKNSLICEKLSIRLSTKFSLRIFCWNDKREPFAAHQNAHLPPVLSLILKVSDVWRFYVGYCTCVLTSGCNILFLQPSVGSWESKEIPVTTAFPVVGVVLHSVCSGYETVKEITSHSLTYVLLNVNSLALSIMVGNADMSVFWLQW